MVVASLDCSHKSWYQVSAELPAYSRYAVLQIMPRDASGDLVGDAVHMPIRPGRSSQRVIYTPENCDLLCFYWLHPSDDHFAADNIPVSLKQIPAWRAAWRMQIRIRNFSPGRSLPAKIALLAILVLFPARLYARYEQTLHYRPRSLLKSKTEAEPCETAWPVLRWLALDELQRAPPLDAKTWVVIRAAGDQWLAGGLMALRDWQAMHLDARVITFDEQRVDDASGTIQPWLKPEWNTDFFLSSAYQGHGVVIRGDLFTELFLYVSNDCFASADELVDALLLAMMADYPREYLKWVTHCPTLALQVNKPVLDEPARQRWVRSRQQRLLTVLDTYSTSARVEPGRLALSWRVRWPLPDPLPLVSLCIPTRNGLSVLKPCMEAILGRTGYQNFEVLVVDNQSDCPATLDYLSQLQTRDQRVRVLRYDKPFNFSAINNYAVARARGQVIGLVNNDIEPRHAEWLGEMVSQALRPDIGCVGAKLFYPDGSIQHAGVVLGIGGVAGHAFRFESGSTSGYQERLELVQNYSAVTAACLLVRKSVYLEAGGLDERLAVNYNDVDFCLKVKALGYRNLWTPYAELTHHESATRGRDRTRLQRKRANGEFALMRKKWGEMLDADPAYHLRLTRVHEDFSLAAGSGQ